MEGTRYTIRMLASSRGGPGGWSLSTRFRTKGKAQQIDMEMFSTPTESLHANSVGDDGYRDVSPTIADGSNHIVPEAVSSLFASCFTGDTGIAYIFPSSACLELWPRLLPAVLVLITSSYTL